MLSVKDNQPTLHREIGQFLLDAQSTDGADDHVRTEEKGRGRRDVREAWVMEDRLD